MTINRTSLARLGFESWREFYTEMGLWAHSHDFTYQGPEDWSQREFIAEFLLDADHVSRVKEAGAWAALICNSESTGDAK